MSEICDAGWFRSSSVDERELDESSCGWSFTLKLLSSAESKGCCRCGPRGEQTNAAWCLTVIPYIGSNVVHMRDFTSVRYCSHVADLFASIITMITSESKRWFRCARRSEIRRISSSKTVHSWGLAPVYYVDRVQRSQLYFAEPLSDMLAFPLSGLFHWFVRTSGISRTRCVCGSLRVIICYGLIFAAAVVHQSPATWPNGY